MLRNAITIALLSLTVSTLAQKNTLYPEPEFEEIQLVVVCNGEECENVESLIFEVYEKVPRRVAHLYPESDDPKSTANVYNEEMIMTVLADYQNEGFEIASQTTDHFEGTCGRKMIYTMVRSTDYAYGPIAK